MAAMTKLVIMFMYWDGVVEMAHMHAYLQEEEDGSIKETIASFLWLRGGRRLTLNYVCCCHEWNHWKYATALIGLS